MFMNLTLQEQIDALKKLHGGNGGTSGGTSGGGETAPVPPEVEQKLETIENKVGEMTRKISKIIGEDEEIKEPDITWAANRTE